MRNLFKLLAVILVIVAGVLYCDYARPNMVSVELGTKAVGLDVYTEVKITALEDMTLERVSINRGSCVGYYRNPTGYTQLKLGESISYYYLIEADNGKYTLPCNVAEVQTKTTWGNYTTNVLNV